MTNLRKISHIIEPQYAIEGAGVLLRCSIAPRASNETDPFLLFDHFAFNDPVEFSKKPHPGPPQIRSSNPDANKLVFFGFGEGVELVYSYSWQ